MRNRIKVTRFLFFLSIIFVLLDTAVPESLEGLKLTRDEDTNPEFCPDTGVSLGMVEDGATGIPAKTYEYRYPQVPLDVDGYPIGPEGLQLEQVHVYVRHGERTPVGVRMNGPPACIPEYWKMCRTAGRFHGAVSSLLHDPQIPQEHGNNETLANKKVLEKRDGTHEEGQCFLGELTDLGKQSTFALGRNLRSLYVNRLGFIPDTLSDKDLVYFRSTNMPRTIESLQQIIHGLYPTNKCHPSAQPPILIRNGKDENLIGNTYSCKRLEILQVGFAQAAAQAYNPILEHLDKRVSKYLNGSPIRVDGKPRASGVMDTIRASIAHGIKVPPEFEDKKIVDVIEQAVVAEWFADKTEEGRRLGVGPLLSDMTRKMQHKSDFGNSDPTKILVHSTHDTAIAAMAAALDVFDEKWPAFTASITFELFKRDEPKPQSILPQSFISLLQFSPTSKHYVRMRYQNKNMLLPLCAQKGDHLEGHPEFCTFDAFKARVKELTPDNWDVECSPAGRVL